MLKRCLVSSTAMLALAVPTAAWGALVGYSGHVVDQESSEIDFDLVRKQGDNEKV